MTDPVPLTAEAIAECGLYIWQDGCEEPCKRDAGHLDDCSWLPDRQDREFLHRRRGELAIEREADHARHVDLVTALVDIAQGNWPAPDDGHTFKTGEFAKWLQSRAREVLVKHRLIVELPDLKPG